MAHAARIYDAGVDGQWYDDLPQFRGDRVERRKHRSSAHRALVRNQQRLFERCRTGLRERRGAQERHGDREPPASTGTTKWGRTRLLLCRCGIRAVPTRKTPLDR